MGLEGRGQAPAQAGLGGGDVLAQAQHDGALVGVHRIQAARQPDHEHQRREHAEAAAELLEGKAGELGAVAATPAVAAAEAAATPGALAAEHAGEALVEIAPDLLEVGRSLVATAIAIAAQVVVAVVVAAIAVFAVAAALATPAWVVQ